MLRLLKYVYIVENIRVMLKNRKLCDNFREWRRGVFQAKRLEIGWKEVASYKISKKIWNNRFISSNIEVPVSCCKSTQQNVLSAAHSNTIPVPKKLNAMNKKKNALHASNRSEIRKGKMENPINKCRKTKTEIFGTLFLLDFTLPSPILHSN